MVKKKVKDVVELPRIVIKDVDPKDVDWMQGSRGKYLEVYKRVRDMKIGEAISVEGANRNITLCSRQWLRKRVKGNWHLRGSYDADTNVAYIMKTDN